MRRFRPGPIAEKWDRHKFEMKLVNPANENASTRSSWSARAWRSASAAGVAWRRLGYNVLNFCIPLQDSSPPRAQHRGAGRHQCGQELPERRRQRVAPVLRHGQSAANYRSREDQRAYRPRAQLSVPRSSLTSASPRASRLPAREYGGLLENRSFGGAQVSRTFYARGQTGQQLLLGAYQSLMRQVHARTVRIFPRREMLDLVLVDGKARGVITRNLTTRRARAPCGSDAVVLATGGYGTLYYLPQPTPATPMSPRRGAPASAERSFLPIRASRRSTRRASPVSKASTSLKLTLMSESLPERRPRVGAEATTGYAIARSRSRRTNATTISSAFIRVSAIWSRVTSPPAMPSRCATTDRGVGEERPRGLSRLL